MKINCFTCKYGYEDERLGIPMCHHPKRFSEDCVNFNMHEEKETEESGKPINPDDAMKELDEKITLVKERGTWDGVDVDKYMDEVRGREPEKPVPNDLEEAANKFAVFYDQGTCDGIAQDCFIAGAKWQAGQLLKGSPTPEDTVLFNKGVEEGRRLAEEEQADLFTIVALDAAQRAKEQMIREAVEGEYDSYPAAVYLDVPIPRMNHGDKVRVIVLPKEDKPLTE